MRRCSVTERVRTSHYVNWRPDSWPADQPVQMSPDISSLIADLSARPGWSAGNAITIFIEPESVTETSAYHSPPNLLLCADITARRHTRLPFPCEHNYGPVHCMFV